MDDSVHDNEKSASQSHERIDRSLERAKPGRGEPRRRRDVFGARSQRGSKFITARRDRVVVRLSRDKFRRGTHRRVRGTVKPENRSSKRGIRRQSSLSARLASARARIHESSSRRRDVRSRTSSSHQTHRRWVSLDANPRSRASRRSSRRSASPSPNVPRADSSRHPTHLHHHPRLASRARARAWTRPPSPSSPIPSSIPSSSSRDTRARASRTGETC